MIRRNLTITILLAILLDCSFGYASEDSLYFRSIRMKDGLPGSTITSFVQDSLGFIWIGTNDGLCRYDGVNFKIFRHDPTSTFSLTDNNIENLHLDKDGNLWVMTSDGLNFFNLRKQQITRIDTENNKLLDNSPTDIVETPDGTIYISSYYSGISLRERGTHEFSHLTTTLLNMEGALASNNINCLELFNDSLLFIGYREYGVGIHNTITRSTYLLDESVGESIISSTINAFCSNRNGGIWIGGSSGLSYYNSNEGSITNYFCIDSTTFIVDREVISLHLDGKGYLWVGTRKNGLVVVRQDDIIRFGTKAEFSHYLPDYKPGSLSYRTILTIFQDRDGQIWLGTHGGGVNLVESKYQRFAHLKHEPENPKSLSNSKVWGLTEDRYGNVGIGTDGGGVNVWNPTKGITRRYSHDPKNPNSLTDNAILSACTDHTGVVWLGTYEGGLNRYDEKEAHFIHYKAPNQLPKNDIRCIYEDPSHNLWVGMNQGGVYKYNREKDKFDSVPMLEYYDVRSILALGDFLWVGTFGEGLIKYNLSSKTIEPFPPKGTNGVSPPIRTVFSLASINPDSLFIGTSDAGLYIYSIKTNRFSVFTENEGLANSKIHAILPDEQGYLWISTNKGISRFRIEDSSFSNFSWLRGIQSEEFSNGSGLITEHGLFCFGGIDGMNYFIPEKLAPPLQKPHIQFTGLKVLNQMIYPQKNGIIESSIEYRPIVNLRHQHSLFSIEFLSLNYPTIPDMHYEYMLEGYDWSWNDAGFHSSATYRNIPPGEYVFRVKCFPHNNKLLTHEAHLIIRMTPPFWKTNLAYGAYITLIALALVAFFRFRMKQYQLKSKLLYEQKLRDKEKKLHEERLDFFANISHELRTPLTILDISIEEISLSSNLHSKVRESVEVAKKNSRRLMELINRLLEFKQIEKGVQNLNLIQINLNTYLSDFIDGFREMALHNHINLELTLPSNELTIWIDQDKLSMILNNLLSNAFKYTPTKGKIIVSTFDNENYVFIKVMDTGIGIEKKFQSKIFKRYYKVDKKASGTGIGLALTKSLVELHRGEITVESTPSIGSSFTLKFLKGNEHFEEHQHNSEQGRKTPDEGGKLFDNDSFLLTGEQKILLLIDDSKEILDLLSDKFMYDFRILRAQDGSEGIHLAHKYCPDIIISDIMMPGISGVEVCQQLKNSPQTSHIPIILLTAKGSEEDEISGLDMGADDYISKPFKFSILQARVNSILDNRQKVLDFFSYSYTDTRMGLPNSTSEDKEMTFLRNVEEYILSECLNTEVSVFKLASNLGFSRTSLYRKIKTLTGMSINAFVRSVRIKKSAELILSGMNVSEAAYSTGFNDLKYFRESFRKQIGKNPSELK